MQFYLVGKMHFINIADLTRPLFSKVSNKFRTRDIVKCFFLSFNLLSVIACKWAYGWHKLVCQPSAGTGVLRAPKRPVGYVLRIL